MKILNAQILLYQNGMQSETYVLGSSPSAPARRTSSKETGSFFAFVTTLPSRLTALGDDGILTIEDRRYTV